MRVYTGKNGMEFKYRREKIKQAAEKVRQIR